MAEAVLDCLDSCINHVRGSHTSFPFMLISTSDYKRNNSIVFWLIWILHRVNAFVSLPHSFYYEVAEVSVEFDSTVDHTAVPHQGHLRQPRNRSVLICDLQPRRWQQDVEILPMEQGYGLIDWII